MEDSELKPSPNNDNDTPFIRFLTQITGSLKNILGVSSVVYVFGYLTWAMYAHKLHLGILPVVKEQYFSVGIIPILIVIIIFSVLHHITISLRKLIKVPHPMVANWTYRLLLILMGCTVFIISSELSELLDYIFFLLLTITYFGHILFKTKSDDSKDEQIFLSAVVVTATLFIIVFIFKIYVDVAFAHIPFELGGGKTTSIRIDLDKNKLSKQAQSYLFDKDTTQSKDTLKSKDTSSNVMSKPLNLIFSTDEYLIVDFGTIDDESRTFRINKSLIQSVLKDSLDVINR